ncbi:protein shisa-5-like [Pelmatolapia mariae]|uniref:protein shisa-5-like n=1 Tax=Pelmatolapia mariae TaxID=158779 RepID=UPI002FE5AC58
MNDIKILIYVIGFILSILFCMCKCLCKSPDNENSVMATADHTTNVNSTSQQYTQQPTAAPGPSQSHQRASYQPAPAQPDDPAELMTTSPSHEQPFLRPPPSYEETTGPAYPLQLMPSSETVFIPSNPLYLSEGTVHEYNGLQDSTDFLTSSACNPEFVIR